MGTNQTHMTTSRKKSGGTRTRLPIRMRTCKNLSGCRSGGLSREQCVSGDEVYFHKGGQPCSGTVLSAGRHGCVVRHEGKNHRVKWHQVSGHKKRVPQECRVVETGEDGVIVENQHGKRRLLAIPADARAERLSVDR